MQQGQAAAPGERAQRVGVRRVDPTRALEGVDARDRGIAQSVLQASGVDAETPGHVRKEGVALPAELLASRAGRVVQAGRAEDASRAAPGDLAVTRVGRR